MLLTYFKLVKGFWVNMYPVKLGKSCSRSTHRVTNLLSNKSFGLGY